MSKALVTGGAGFIGSSVAELLVAEGYEVVILDNLTTGYRKNVERLTGTTFVEGDVRDADLVNRLTHGVQVIFHLAASVGNTRSIERPVEDSEVNVIGTLRLLEAARSAGVRKIVCSSSAAIFGELKHLPIGHFEDSFMPAPPHASGGKSTVQGIGSTNSYLRRYIACNIFNIVVVGDDDDGTGGTIDEAQMKTILDLIKKAKVGPKFLKYMRAQSIEEAGSLEAAVATIASRDYRKAITTLEEQIDGTLIQERLVAKLLGFFGLLALVLACVGLYGVMSYAVVRRTSEIGIRMALGARRTDVTSMVLRETLVLVIAGVALGVPAALASTHLLRSLLFGLTPTDPVTIGAMSVLMLAIAVLAGYVPARRAANVDPMVALRYE